MNDDDDSTLSEEHFLGVWFTLCAECPGPWRTQAYDLRWAADAVDWMKHGEGDGTDWRVGVYLFLIGQSVENLIKGILIAQGRNVFVASGKPDSDFWNHDLVKLADQIDRTALAISEDENDILEGLSKFVAWAGRYPMPSKREHMLIVEHSTPEYFAELDLWERLFNHLQAVGWWLGTGKRRLAFNDDLATTLPKRATS